MPGKLRVLCLLLLAGWTSGLAAEELTIATFNAEFLSFEKVHRKYGLPLDLKDPEQLKTWSAPGYRQNRLEESTRAVAKTLAQLNADIIALTEVGSQSDIDLLAKELEALGSPYPFALACDCQEEYSFQTVAVLSRRALREPLLSIPGYEFYDEELDDEDSEKETDLGKGMKVVFDFEGKPVHLFVVHLKSERGGHESDARRLAQASIVRRWTRPLLEKGEQVIVAGDLNDHRGDPPLRRIRGRDDEGPDLIQSGQRTYFNPKRMSERWTYEFWGSRNQIDHILLSRSFLTQCGPEGIRSDVPLQPSNEVSDHRPLVVHLSCPDALEGPQPEGK